MRITNSMMVNQFLSESNDALNRVSKYQSQVDSTKRLTGIADDPQGTLTALRARNKLSNLDLYKTNISTATSYLNQAETATSSLNEVLQSAYEDIVSAQSGAKTTGDQQTLAEDLKNLRDEVLSISNTTMGTSYIFGGYNYTGSISAGTKTPPFTVDSVTGHLSYNGIDLSQFSWSNEYDNQTSQMASDVTAFSAIADPVTGTYKLTSTDAYNKDLGQSALDTVNNLIANGKSALDAAKSFGIDPNSPNYKALSDFINGTDTGSPPVHTPGLVDLTNSLSNEMSLELSTGPTDTVNKFNAANTQTALTNIFNYMTGTPSLNTLTGNLQADLSGPTGVLNTPLAALNNLSPQAALDNEQGKTTKLQIGTAQTVDATFTGLDFMGTGVGNIYHILDKAVNMLNSGASADQLSPLITSIQNAQSNVMTLDTKIGASQNRLTLISNRYDSNESNYTEMKSNAEDADMAEAIMNLNTAQTVYNAALAGGAKILQTSLIDFLR